jgi:hypothetical protein
MQDKPPVTTAGFARLLCARAGRLRPRDYRAAPRLACLRQRARAAPLPCREVRPVPRGGVRKARVRSRLPTTATVSS